ncbi:MAG: rhamnogalacturonan acetylesterase, partial [Bacteroidota bacterium]|nr:rhamnogalacturonan acetylesterase [Bacteroidota bacterium]
MKKFLFVVSLIGLSVFQISAATVYRFDFGSGKVKKGYVKVDSRTLYANGKGYGFDLVEPPVSQSVGRDPLTGDACVSDHGFFFSVDVPEGNYRVHVLLGNAKAPSETT